MHARKSAVSAAVLVVLAIVGTAATAARAIAPVKNRRIVFDHTQGLLAGILVAAFLLCVTAAGASRPSAPSPQHTKADRGGTRYPNSIVVLGDGGAAGHASDPAHPSRDAPVNSWATGTNPAVKSIYSRILSVNPAVRRHNVNLAQDDPTAAEFAAQLQRAIALNPKPDLVIVQFGDRAIASCDGQDATHYADFRANWTTTLDTLTTGLPNAQLLLVSPWGGSYGASWGSFDSYAKYLNGLTADARLKHAGKHLCQFVDSSSGRVVPARVAYMKKTWAGYEAQKSAACAQYPRCHYDQGVAGRITATAADIAPGGGYPSIQGNAKLAAAEWTAIASFVDRLPASP